MPQLDPYRNTREEYTYGLIQKPIPEDAHPQWKALNQALKDLLHALVYHESMAENRQQSFMTPAASKNRIYHLWDFAGRTLNNLYNVPWRLDARGEMDAKLKRVWTLDCVGRSLMISGLILDKRNELNRMVEVTNPEERGRHPEFGEEIEQLARKLEAACTGNGAEGSGGP